MWRRALKTREFLAEAAELLRIQLPPDLRDVQVVGPLGSLIKLHYGDPKLHYEVWIRRRQGIVEVGLHFEGTTERNLHYLQEITSRYEHVLASFGPELQAERWTASWTRLHQLVPFTTLDEDLLMEVTDRLSRMVWLLEPVVRKISGPTPGTSGEQG